jgi:hypothetical protein
LAPGPETVAVERIGEVVSADAVAQGTRIVTADLSDEVSAGVTASPIDHSDDEPSAATAQKGLEKPTIFNLDQAQEETRGMIAGSLVALLFVTVIFSFLSLWNDGDADPDHAKLKSVLELIFAPLVTLVGSATGFYFGGKKRSLASPSCSFN